MAQTLEAVLREASAGGPAELDALRELTHTLGQGLYLLSHPLSRVRPVPLERWGTPAFARRISGLPRWASRYNPGPPYYTVVESGTRHVLWGQRVGRYLVAVFAEEAGWIYAAVLRRGEIERILHADVERAAGGDAGPPRIMDPTAMDPTALDLKRAEAIKSAELAVETLTADENYICQLDIDRFVHGLENATERTVTPEDTLRSAGIDGKRQAAYQRKMSAMLAGRA